MADNVTYQFGKSQLTIEFGDIVNSEAQVLVSSDDRFLTMGGGVSAAIRRAGGDDITLDAAKKIPAQVGDVVVTTAGKLPAHYIFHVITRDQLDSQAAAPEVLYQATRKCMQLLDALGVRSIAFPAFGAGTAGFELDEVAAQMAKVIAPSLQASAESIEVTIYLYDRNGKLNNWDFLPFIRRFDRHVPEFSDHKTASAATAPPTAARRDQVFISYSHKNKDWLERLQTMIKPLMRKQGLTVWDDTKIKAGSSWRDEISQVLAGAKVALLLVSPEFLASDFIVEKELPPLLNAAKNDGLTVLWVYLSPCLYQESAIELYQAAHDISRPLDALSVSEQNAHLVRICQEVKKAMAGVTT
jgi:O-acetyl-ADP-ribose deacetylase (regulator of RNase III)